MRIARAWEAALVAAALAVAGCSGGEDGGGGNGGDPPVADAGSDRVGRLHQPLSLDGTGSADPEGKDLTYAWVLLSAPEASVAVLTSAGSASAAFTPDADGTYLVGLTVSDGKKTSTLDTAEVDVPVRIGVFGDASRALVSALALETSFDADDFTAHPDSQVIAASGTVVLFLDERTHDTSIIAHDLSTDIQETIAVGEIEDVVTDGAYVAWLEHRNGQWDVFARDFETGTESQRTNSTIKEGGLHLAGRVLVWHEEVNPLDRDVFAYDFLTGTGYVVAEGAVDQNFPRTDGATIVFNETQGADEDVRAFDVMTMVTNPIAVSTTSLASGAFVSGDYVVYAVSSTAGLSLERHRLSDGAKARVPGYGTPMYAEGDWVLFEGASGELKAYGLSTGVTVDVSSGSSRSDLEGDVVTWSDPAGGGGGDIWTMVLPGGTPTQVTGTPDLELQPALTQGGLAWSVRGAGGILDVVHSTDGGASTTLLSDGKVQFAEVLADYDVAFFANDADGVYARTSLDAAIAAGLPVLAAKGGGDGALDHWVAAGDYGLASNAVSCGPVSVQFGPAHPAFEGFFGGSTAVVDPVGDGSGEFYAESFTAAGDEAPPDFAPLAYYGAGMCNAGDTAIATFTTPEGTAVIVDGAGGDLLEAGLWNTERLRLFESELRWLASTRAP